MRRAPFHSKKHVEEVAVNRMGMEKCWWGGGDKRHNIVLGYGLWELFVGGVREQVAKACR